MTIDMNKKLPRPARHHTECRPASPVEGSVKVLEFQKGSGTENGQAAATCPTERSRTARSAIGDSVVMFGEAMPGPPGDARLVLLYVDNGNAVDATYKRALAAGATSAMEPANQFYGYRSATCATRAGTSGRSARSSKT